MHLSNTSDILALLAIVVSLLSAAYQWYLDSHMNRINLEADYFKELYLEHLLYKLPKARAHIRISLGKLTDIDPLIDELNLIRQNSLYFMYADKDFYADLKLALRGLEDYLIENGEMELNNEEKEEVWRQIQIRLEEIYRIFNNKYIGN